MEPVSNVWQQLLEKPRSQSSLATPIDSVLLKLWAHKPRTETSVDNDLFTKKDTDFEKRKPELDL